ncbi:hypothetical protein VOLCADRAFT_94477 [Volvox carteri f. nagariensis]|uniref:F-box domain-containing protein n=1 Tax=Volvox carteri f. nagariensis TaxID=3068 RepID=D8U4W8_VOLCA|nr:uncharacterized protein VOLCADRAFT_94477 [Volvox carteri f. nagariensis]EFJ45346.1 hypothetical protein VOLCADRAFT_94477 [Volvox carteri f. nagariensis]|eukprot:XP_002953722.1 hypothetical protein VOLCADRAFT_94477 [Volvox carteri f. nagariensis]
MSQPRSKARPKRTGDGPCAEDGPPPPFRSWQAPPDGLFDVIVRTLTAKQFVVVQLVCKDWSRSARYCLKDATPKRPDVDLSKLATLYPNLTQLNLSHVEGLSTRMLAPLRQLTALRELCLSNIALKHNHHDTTNAGARDVVEGEAAAATAAAAAGKGRAGGPGTARAVSDQRTPHLLPQRHTRSRARGGMQTGHGGSGARSPGQSPTGTGQKLPATAGPSSTRAAGSAGDGEATGGSPSVCDSPPTPQQRKPQDTTGCDVGGLQDAAAGTSPPVQAGGAGVGGCVGTGRASGAAGGSGAAASPGSSPPLSPASRIFGGLGDVLQRLNKLQADLCPALTADAIACLPNLTDLTLDTLVAPEALAPLGRLRCLAVKKLANPEALERLSGLTALLVNSDSSCASEFLPVCTRLPELQSLTFKTSSTKVLQQPDTLCWQGFSRLSSLDLRAPAECLKPGLPALAELAVLRSLSLDLYCASDEELMVTVVAPPNLDSLFVSSDRSRSGGVIDVHPNPGLRSLRIRLYWTALNLVLPEGVPEPSPLPEPLSDDLDLGPLGSNDNLHSPRSNSLRVGGAAAAGTALASPPEAGWRAAARVRDVAGAAAAAAAAGTAVGPPAADVDTAGGSRELQRGAEADLGQGRRFVLAPAGIVDADVTTVDRQEPCVTAGTPAPATDAGAGRPCGRGLRRRRDIDGSPSPLGGGANGGGQAAEGAGVTAAGGSRGAGGVAASPERGLRRRIVENDGGGAAAAAVEPSSGGRGAAATLIAGDSSENESGGGSDGGSSEEEVGFRGAHSPSGSGGGAAVMATAAAITGSAGKYDGAANADFRRLSMLADAADGGGAANAGGAHASRRQVTPRVNRHGAADSAAAVEGPPRVDRRCSSGSAHRGSASVSTPVSSVGGAMHSNLPEMELQELCLDACFFLLYGSLVPLLRQFPRLRQLTLDNCLALENGELTQLCELSGLRELSLSGLHLVTDVGLRALGRLPNLTSLRVKGLRKLSVHAAQAYMRQKPIVRRYEEISGTFLTSLSGLHELRSLTLKHLHTAGEGALAAGLGALTQLTRFEIKDVHSMSDKVLLALTGHTGLQDLSVLHCEAVTSRGRNAIVRALGQRVALDFEGCSLPDITRPCALPTASTQAQLIDDDQVSSSNQPRRSYQHSNQH